MRPVVQRVTFPEDIRNNIVSQDNKKGQIIKSDLLMVTEVLVIRVVLESSPSDNSKSLGKMCNNTLTVIWISKMASKAN